MLIRRPWFKQAFRTLEDSEQANPEVCPATVDADALTKMYKEGKLKDMVVDGPMALDIAVSKHAAEHKENKQYNGDKYIRIYGGWV